MWTKEKEIVPSSGTLTCVRFSPDGTMVAFSTTTGVVTIVASDNFEEISSKTVHKKAINELAWSRDAKLILSCSDDGNLVLLRSSDLEIINIYSGHQSYVVSCDIACTSIRLVSGSYDESIRIWDTVSGRSLRMISAHSEPVSSVRFNSDGCYVLSSSWDGLCRIWDVYSGVCIKAYEIGIPLTYATLTPNDKYLLIQITNSTIKLIDIDTGKLAAIYRGHINEKFCLTSGFSIDPNGRTELYCPSENGLVIGWDLTEQTKKWDIIASAGSTVCCAIDPSGTKLVTGSGASDCTIRLWTRISHRNIIENITIKDEPQELSPPPIEIKDEPPEVSPPTETYYQEEKRIEIEQTEAPPPENIEHSPIRSPTPPSISQAEPELEPTPPPIVQKEPEPAPIIQHNQKDTTSIQDEIKREIVEEPASIPVTTEEPIPQPKVEQEIIPDSPKPKIEPESVHFSHLVNQPRVVDEPLQAPVQNPVQPIRSEKPKNRSPSFHIDQIVNSRPPEMPQYNRIQQSDLLLHEPVIHSNTDFQQISHQLLTPAPQTSVKQAPPVVVRKRHPPPEQEKKKADPPKKTPPKPAPKLSISDMLC